MECLGDLMLRSAAGLNVAITPQVMETCSLADFLQHLGLDCWYFFRLCPSSQHLSSHCVLMVCCIWLYYWLLMSIYLRLFPKPQAWWCLSTFMHQPPVAQVLCELVTFPDLIWVICYLITVSRNCVVICLVFFVFVGELRSRYLTLRTHSWTGPNMLNSCINSPVPDWLQSGNFFKWPHVVNLHLQEIEWLNTFLQIDKGCWKDQSVCTVC